MTLLLRKLYIHCGAAVTVFKEFALLRYQAVSLQKIVREQYYISSANYEFRATPYPQKFLKRVII